MNKKIVRIPKKAAIENKKLRVSIYARVSTLKENQAGSLQLQQKYFIQYIRSKKDWELVDIYFDEGISGVRMTNRSGFNRMLDDARKGKFDYIVIKSISRFARNTVDTINTIMAYKDFLEKNSIKVVRNCFLFPTEKDEIIDNGEVYMNMFSNLEKIKIRIIPAKVVYNLYLNNKKLDINLLNL